LLQVQDLSKQHFGQTAPAIRGVSFRLNEGELLALVGESGCGKSSLLRIIAGLSDADAGFVKLFDKHVVGPSYRLVAGHPDIKLVHQDYQLMPRHTIWENIAYALRKYTAAYQKSRVGELMERCRISPLANKLPAELSGGEQQRVALACSLAEIPKLLLLDEPFSNLDLANKNTIRQEIADMILENGTTAIWVTHDAAEALAFPQKVALMWQGEWIQYGTPQNLYQTPQTEYAARFFGSANILSVSDLKRLWPAISIPETSNLACLRYENICALEQPHAGSLPFKCVATRFLGFCYEVDLQFQDILLTTRLPLAQKEQIYHVSLHANPIFI
jgi:ABC-type Fe3+/spermidine/putrescine transport system ATPase subunit